MKIFSIWLSVIFVFWLFFVKIKICVENICIITISLKIQNIMKNEMKYQDGWDGELKSILEYTEDPIVSSDVIGTTVSATFDAGATMTVSENMVKIFAWYDNEWGYSNRYVDVIYYAHYGKMPAWLKK